MTIDFLMIQAKFGLNWSHVFQKRRFLTKINVKWQMSANMTADVKRWYFLGFIAWEGTIETKEAAHIGYNLGFFPHSYSGERPWVLHLIMNVEKKLLYPIWAASLVSIVMYLTCTIMML